MAKSGAFSTSNEYIKYTIEIIQNSQSVANNTSNVTVKVRFYRTNTGYTTYGSGTVYCRINGTKYSASVTSSQKITSSGIVLFTKTLNITHGSDGTKTLTCSAWIDHDRVTSSEQSYSQTLTTIPRKSTLSVSNGTLGTQQTLTVERKSTSFKHRITATCGGTKLYIKADGTTSEDVVEHTDCSIPFTPPLSWAKSNTTGTTVTVEWGIGTYTSDGTRVGGNTYTKTYTIPSSVKPSLSVSISEATALDWGVYVQSVSRLAVKITPTTAYGSAISTYKTTIDGKTYTASSFTTEVLKGKGSLAIAVTITDKRGRTATYNGTINVLEYTPPSITNLSVIRCNEDGTSNKQGSHAKVSFNYKFVSLGGKNSLDIDTNYKLKSETEYTPLGTSEPTSTEGTETHIFAADTTLMYDVEIVATDSIQSLFDRTPSKGIATLGTINKFMQWFKDVGLSFGKFFDTTKPYSLQVGWDIYDKYDTQIRNGVVAYASAGIDANTTLEHCFLTTVNTPTSSQFWYVIQYFYSTKSETANRMQVAYPYKAYAMPCHRYYVNGAWSAWEKAANETAVADSGWKTPTLSSYFAAYNSDVPPRYRKIGKQVDVTGTVKPKSTIAGSGTNWTIFTLPSGYRPPEVVYVWCQGSAKRHWLLRIGNDGTVSFSRYGSSGGYLDAPTDAWLPFHATFFVD